MSAKQAAWRQIEELCFAEHELVLYLDTHPDSREAAALLRDYRAEKQRAQASYRDRFGALPAVTVSDVPATAPWRWTEGPWPWEYCETEGKPHVAL